MNVTRQEGVSEAFYPAAHGISVNVDSHCTTCGLLLLVVLKVNYLRAVA